MTVIKNITLISAAVLLFLAFVDGLPYEFFTVLRWVVCAVSIFAAYTAHTYGRGVFIWIFGFIALLFNPILPAHLGRELWLAVDAVVGILMLASVFILKPREENAGGE